MILGIVQARASSTRLPGKVLLPILGEPMLARQLERVGRAGTLDEVIVATSTDRSDDALETVCATAGVACCRGSLDDVLDRFRACAEPYAPDHVVRLTGDCPLTDPVVIDEVVAAHLASGDDYTSNVDPPTFPDGLDVEVVTREALEAAWSDARLPSEREHVTSFIRGHGERFNLGNVVHEPDLSALRWTVDEPEDLAFVTAVYEALYPGDPGFGTADVLALLERRPELKKLNAHIGRNEGMTRSLKDDEAAARRRDRS